MKRWAPTSQGQNNILRSRRKDEKRRNSSKDEVDKVDGDAFAGHPKKRVGVKYRWSSTYDDPFNDRSKL